MKNLFYSLVFTEAQMKFLNENQDGVNCMKALASLACMCNRGSSWQVKDGLNVMVGSGQLVTSVKDLAALWNQNIETVTALLDVLVREKMIFMAERDAVLLLTLRILYEAPAPGFRGFNYHNLQSRYLDAVQKVATEKIDGLSEGKEPDFIAVSTADKRENNQALAILYSIIGRNPDGTPKSSAQKKKSDVVSKGSEPTESGHDTSESKSGEDIQNPASEGASFCSDGHVEASSDATDAAVSQHPDTESSEQDSAETGIHPEKEQKESASRSDSHSMRDVMIDLLNETNI